jgi:hypothetical protein
VRQADTEQLRSLGQTRALCTGACHTALPRLPLSLLLALAPQDLFHNFNSQLLYFCPWGNPACVARDASTLEAAKKALESYDAVGILDRLSDTLAVFEALMPQVRRGAAPRTSPQPYRHRHPPVVRMRKCLHGVQAAWNRCGIHAGAHVHGVTWAGPSAQLAMLSVTRMAHHLACAVLRRGGAAGAPGVAREPG